MSLFVCTLGWAGVAAYPGWGVVRRRAFEAACAVAAVAGIWNVARTVREAARALSQWDFLCFYLYGRVAVLTRAVYDPVAFERLGSGLSSDPGWVREVLGVGFPYPPDSIVVPYALGFFKTPQAAFVPWYALLLAGLIACVAYARRYLAGPWVPATLVALAFACFWTPAIETLHLGQTIFLVAALTFAYASERNDRRAGVWLGLAVVVKPFALAFALVPLVRRQWRTLGAVAGTLFAAFGVATILLGPATIGAYFSANPAGRYPQSAFIESDNISLLSTFLRVGHGATAQIAFVVCALAFVAATAYLIARVRGNERDDYALALAVCCGLIVFPQTIVFYPFVLFVPFAIVWKRTNANPIAAAAAIALDATLVGTAQGNAGTALLALNWCAFAYLLWRSAPVTR